MTKGQTFKINQKGDYRNGRTYRVIRQSVNAWGVPILVCEWTDEPGYKSQHIFTPAELETLASGPVKAKEPVILNVYPNGINEMGRDSFFVSSSNGAHKYTVEQSPLGFKCSCPGYTFNKRCKHIAAVVQFAPTSNHQPLAA